VVKRRWASVKLNEATIETVGVQFSHEMTMRYAPAHLQRGYRTMICAAALNATIGRHAALFQTRQSGCKHGFQRHNRLLASAGVFFRVSRGRTHTGVSSNFSMYRITAKASILGSALQHMNTLVRCLPGHHTVFTIPSI